MCPAKEPAKASREVDSYCFQSVAQEHVPLIAQCMGLPLYQGVLAEGTSKNQNLWYEETQGDEVEDLYALLLKIKQLHPEINAISTGAIESNYQRIRIVHICERLGLTHLAFLWKSSPEEILNEVIVKGVRAMIVKVSSMGLPPEEFLGKIIDRDIAKRLLKIPYIHAAGEGGEFETFTLDSPLFHEGCLKVTDQRIEVMQESDV
eukprot:CAMPEP_0201529808 /NCGR_PEP_ID=MMETSP0161_2-20130828/42844_1 /ASSEMBLY_ACC=CAM_ASM_000251 /TAXON_ID=180227 /ORGANISM="Neoparamoeba aestuarina, Strain SoJaBio B1-5/56/2" /LENGTH=204 /DNA_ID=CAMNT_0047931805 /DNA_START=69 /DNA_END=680 /DNA_ORIENTATION=+